MFETQDKTIVSNLNLAMVNMADVRKFLIHVHDVAFR